MKMLLMFGLIAAAMPGIVYSADAETGSAIRDHEIGRVFMSDAERRRLDKIRAAIPAADGPGQAVAAAQPQTAPAGRRSAPVGYIVSPHGRPYQWIDGDFRPVRKAQVVETESSRSFRIIRHSDTSSGETESDAPDALEEDDAEAGNAPRKPD